MNAPARLATFAGAVALVFVAGLGVGRALDTSPPGSTRPRSDASAGGGDGGDDASAEHAATGHGGGDTASSPEVDAEPVRGLSISENGLRLRLTRTEPEPKQASTLEFSIATASGEALRDFDATHTKRMHLIVVRRDLTGFQHLHPRMAADGTWSTPLTLTAPGSWRVFADFAHEGTPVTLAADLQVSGAADLMPLPQPEPTAVSTGGYDVRLDAMRAGSGDEQTLTFTISRDGQPVDLEPYLGAGGHLVALREGDLGFLHVHPAEHGGEHAEGDGRVAFVTTFPGAGRYRLFLQFQVDGVVETTAFTQVVDER